MTLKEQIMKLQTYKMHEGENTVYVERDDVLKALEKQLCEDTISREQAIDVVADLFEMSEYPHPYSQGKPIRLKDIKEKLKQLPPVQPKITNKSEKLIGSNDCIDRAQAQTAIEMSASRYTIAKERNGMGQVEWSDQLIKVSDAVDIIRHLSSVTPQEQKTGQWILLDECSNSGYYCSECHKKLVKEGWSGTVKKIKFCPNCGSYLGGD